MYQTIKTRTGNHVILHLDYHKENAEAYILDKLDTHEQDKNIDVFYIGGGHGGGIGGRVDDETSGLKKKSIIAVTDKLRAKGMTTGAAISGSCYSGAFTNLFRNFIIDEGVMFSDSVECDESIFKQTARWMQSPENNALFTPENIDAHKVRTSFIRDKLIEFIGDVNTITNNRHLLAAYADETHKDIKTLTDKEMQDDFSQNPALKMKIEAHRTDMLDKEVEAYANDIAAIGPTATPSELMVITKKYPKIQDHINDALSKTVFTDNFSKFLADIKQHIDDYKRTANPDPAENPALLFMSRVNYYCRLTTIIFAGHPQKKLVTFPS